MRRASVPSSESRENGVQNSDYNIAMDAPAQLTQSPIETKTREQIDELADAIAVCAARIDAATHQLLTYIREFDLARGWAAQGAKSCAHWLSWRIGCGLAAAAEKVRAARALGELPRIDSALEAGQLSYCKVRAMTRVATPDNEELLLEQARTATGAQLEKVCSGLRRAQRIVEHGALPHTPPDRYVRKRHTQEGMVRIELLLHPDEAELVWQALHETKRRLRAANDSDSTASETEAGDQAPELSAESGAAEVSAEGVAEVSAESGVADLSAESGAPARGSDDSSTAPTLADAAVALAEQCLASAQLHKARPGGERRLLMVHLRQEQLEGGLRAELHDGTPLCAETLLRCACDSGIVAVKTDDEGNVLDIGRKTRVPSPALMRALKTRHRRCAFPGCTCEAYLEAHHLEHWAQGGETSLQNTALLCWFHHHEVHEGGFRVERGDDGQLSFFEPGGRRIEPVACPPVLEADAMATLIEEQGRAGVEIDRRTSLPDWDGRPLDLDGAVSALARRAEAGLVAQH